MKNSSDFNFDDLQALLCYSHKDLRDTCFLLLDIVDANAAKQWLEKAPISSATQTNAQPITALQIAFSVEGLRALGLNDAVIDSFSDEFIIGMSGDESRSRRLDDIDSNAPKHWDWGGNVKNIPHILLLLYAKKDGIKAWRKEVQGEHFLKAFKLLKELPTLDIGNIEPFGFDIEPFGFADGISQPQIDWARQQSTDSYKRDRYSNLLAVGEIVLGYRNEYGQYTQRPLIDPDPKNDIFAAVLPNAEDQPTLKDFGRNGSYLVLRQLGQDVPGFWQFLYKASSSVPKKQKHEQLAAAMVGRNRDGSPLIKESKEDIPGINSKEDHYNNFTYNDDAKGLQCPIGAHIRRANPRTGDLPPGVTGWITRLIKILGFGGKRPDEDLVASSRFHRMLRRARSYGSLLTPEEAIKPDALVAERGLQFICLVANISRQFEFVQNAWVMSSKFNGVQQESDPLLGHRKPLLDGDSTDQFNRPDSAGSMHKTCHLPQFITVRGGGYFFMPGLQALKYIAALPSNGSDK